MVSNASRNACVPVLSLSSVLSATFFVFFCALLRCAPVPLLGCVAELFWRVIVFHIAPAADYRRTIS